MQDQNVSPPVGMTVGGNMQDQVGRQENMRDQMERQEVLHFTATHKNLAVAESIWTNAVT
jgi:hypothetical protein